MNRPRRLQSAVHWIPKYEGKNLVSGYSKHFGVDKLCAVTELEILGYPIKESYKQDLKNAVKQKQGEKERRKKLKQLEHEAWEDSDGTFAFIAGHTSWGFPYGITWEEWDEMEAIIERETEKDGKNKEAEQPLYPGDDDLPF